MIIDIFGKLLNHCYQIKDLVFLKLILYINKDEVISHDSTLAEMFCKYFESAVKTDRSCCVNIASSFEI